jgi:hypothetical protein
MACLAPAASFRNAFAATLPAVRREKTRWERDNEMPLNPWAFVAVGGFALLVAGIALLLALI